MFNLHGTDQYDWSTHGLWPFNLFLLTTLTSVVMSYARCKTDGEWHFWVTLFNPFIFRVIWHAFE